MPKIGSIAGSADRSSAIGQARKLTHQGGLGEADGLSSHLTSGRRATEGRPERQHSL